MVPGNAIEAWIVNGLPSCKMRRAARRPSSYTASLRSLLLAGGMATVAARGAQLDVAGGVLVMNGSLVADNLSVGPGATITGTGKFTGQGTIQGTLSPGTVPTGSEGVLQFGSSLAFVPGSTFACYAASHTNLSRIIAAGPVTGTAQVLMSKAAGAIPLNQPIINGGGGSSYALFSLSGTSTNWQLSTSNAVNLLVTDLAGDSNANGIPDWWEAAYFGGRTNCNPNGDSDNDGMKNGEEYAAGTLPTNAASRLFINAVVSFSSNKTVLTWSSVSNRSYFIQSATNLGSGFVSTIASNIPATPPSNTHTNSNGGTAALHYRVGLQP